MDQSFYKRQGEILAINMEEPPILESNEDFIIGEENEDEPTSLIVEEAADNPAQPDTAAVVIEESASVASQAPPPPPPPPTDSFDAESQEQEAQYQKDLEHQKLTTMQYVLDKSKWPVSYWENTPKEKVVLEYVSNFNRQYVQLYPGRKELILEPRNEFDVKVSLSLLEGVDRQHLLFSSY
jgi:hypothetical protein